MFFHFVFLGQKLFRIIFLATLLAAVLADYDDYYEDDYESESVYDRDSGKKAVWLSFLNFKEIANTDSRYLA